jgi:hypothetical protein
MFVSVKSVFLWAVVLSSLAAPTAAQRGSPGSLLLFPEYDTTIGAGVVNLITVTNTELDTPNGSMETYWEYVNGWDCSRTQVIEPLNGADTLTVYASAHAHTTEMGYLYVYAVDADSQQPMVHNHLIGTSIIIDGLGGVKYTIDPLSFDGIGDGTYTDLDADGVRDLDGMEYAMVSDTIILPRFLGQSSVITSDLVMIDLTGGAGFTTTIDFLIFNDNEEVFSAEHSFQCWTKVPLLNVSGIFDNFFLSNYTNHDPNEVLGATYIESGWVEMHGDETDDGVGPAIEDPAFACILIDRRVDTGTRTAIHPVGMGTQNNGSLFPNGDAAGPGRSR